MPQRLAGLLLLLAFLFNIFHFFINAQKLLFYLCHSCGYCIVVINILSFNHRQIKVMRVSEISCHVIILWVRAFISRLRGRHLLLVLLSWMNSGVIGDRSLSFCKGIFPFDPIKKFPILMRKFKLIINIYF